MNCIICETDNLTDYPACPSCALTAHFPSRTDCIHCQYAQDTRIDINTLQQFLDWIRVEKAGPTKWAVVDPEREVKRFANEKGYDLE